MRIFATGESAGQELLYTVYPKSVVRIYVRLVFVSSRLAASLLKA